MNVPAEKNQPSFGRIQNCESVEDESLPNSPEKTFEKQDRDYPETQLTQMRECTFANEIEEEENLGPND